MHVSRRSPRRLFLLTLVSLVLLSSTNYGTVQAGDDCGSKEGTFNKLLSAFVVPDYFPPEKPGARLALLTVSGGLSSSFEACPVLGRAPLKNACVVHDLCYETPGANKDQCDRDLEKGWIAACESTYENISRCDIGGILKFGPLCIANPPDPDPLLITCQVACRSTAVLLSKAMRFDTAGSCPSCDAFCEAQKKTLGQFSAKGLFVNQSFSGTGIGTAEQPFRSIGQALKVLANPEVSSCNLAAANSLRIILHAGTYPESIVIDKQTLLTAEGGLVTVGK